MAVLHITKENFKEEVLQSKEPVLLDFWASWCGPCRTLGPIIEEIGAEAQGFKVGKVNVDDEPKLAEEFSIMSIPTLLVIKNGEITAQTAGVKPKAQILALLD